MLLKNEADGGTERNTRINLHLMPPISPFGLRDIMLLRETFSRINCSNNEVERI